MVVATLLHLPLVPVRFFDWLTLIFGAKQMEIADMDGEIVIPIDLDLIPGEPAKAGPTATDPTEDTEPAPDSSSTATKKPDKKNKDEAADAGTDAEAPDAGEDAEAPDAGVGDAAGEDAASGEGDAGPIASIGDAGPDAEIVAATPPDAGEDASEPIAVAELDAGADAGPTIKDPLAAAGAPSSLASKNPNVQILIAGDRIRKHELGTWFSRILVTIPQWQSFFKDTPIDPIRDIDHLLIAGPQLRDSRKIVAVMDFNVPEPKIRDSIDAILKRSSPPGRWLEGTPVPAALAKADNGERIFAMSPGKRLLVVIPAEAKDDLAKVKSLKPFNKSSGVGIALSMATPHRAFKGLPFEIPDTFKWMRLSVTPTDDGGADVLLEALDDTPDHAREHAEKLGNVIEPLRKELNSGISVLAVLGMGPEPVAPITFSTEGSLVRSKLHVTNKQLRLIMSKVEQELTKQLKEREAKAGGKKEK
jgi:hypothetical protein